MRITMSHEITRQNHPAIDGEKHLSLHIIS